MPNLYLFYVGGLVAGATIEVHDVQFVVADSPTDAYPVLVERWWGTPESIHIDTYARVSWADGYDVTISPTPPAGAERLYFVNMGGVLPGSLQESHEFGLFVATSDQEAKRRGLASLLKGVPHQHRDNLYDVDDCLVLDQVQSSYVHLTPNPDGTPLRPDYQGYIVLGRR